MYRKPLTKIFVAIGAACTVFVLVFCTIAFVRIYRAAREMEESQEVLEAQKEEMADLEKELKKAERREKKRLEEEEEKIKPEPSPSVSPTPSPTPSPRVTQTPMPRTSPSPSPEAVVSTDREPAAGEQKAATGAGHIVGIDPGHQGPHVDMSATEPNGPGSTEMKAKATSGTSGAYSGLGEYQLNLDVSLKLQEILQGRGYQVVMTRTDNDTAISNAERALLAADSGAEIYVRIHANGSDDHGTQGALSMCPSQDNPYVPELYSDSLRLSQQILDAYCAATGFEDRGVQFNDNMTGINWSRVPVTILEMGFMTNEHDDLAMAEAVFQQTMAEGIADGIDAYFAGSGG